jgi:chemotaxis protein MotA
LAERLGEVASEDITMREIIKDGMLMVQEKKHPSYIEEYLKSFLAPKERGTDQGAKARRV